MLTKLSLRDCKDQIPINVPNGYCMCWSFTTQAGNRVSAKLFDDAGNVYMDVVRQSTEALPMETGEAYMKGNNLYLRIDIPESEHIEVRKMEESIKDERSGKPIAINTVILAEDWKDYDFNDVQLTITAFSHKG